MFSKSFLYLAFITCILSARGQSSYLVGSSNVSIEPDSSIFSLALAGYGAPKEGRFSITWKYISRVSDLKALVGLNGKFYAVTAKDELLVGISTDQSITWTVVGNAKNIQSLGVFNGKLYASTNRNQLIVGTPVPEGISWKRAGKAGQISGFAGLNGQLYAATARNKLLAGTFSSNRVSWATIGEIPDTLISMTSDGQKIYAINANDSLWSGMPEGNEIVWTEIGRNNAETYNIRIKHITVLNNRLYALSNDGKLYLAEHSTNGNLSARALAIKQRDETIVIVGVDIVTFSSSFIKEIKEALFEKRGLPEAAILINGSHTHFGPITQNWLTWEDFYHRPDSNYMNIVKEGIIRSVELALDNMTPSAIYFGRGNTNIGYNRRGSYNPDKPYDKTLDVLKIQSESSNQNNVMFLTGCHPVAFKKGPEAFTLSANFPAVARHQIENKFNANNSIFIQGCAGDINPRSNNYVQTGNELAKDVLQILESDLKRLKGKISYSLDTIQIAVKPWSVARIEEFKMQNSIRAGNLEADKNIRWANLMLKKYKENKVPTSLPVLVQTINIGEWKLVGLSREVVTEYGPAIRKIWPDKLVSVAGYCNDISSYLPNRWHVEAKLYEGNESFFWYGETAFFPEDVLEALTGKIKSLNK